VANKYSFQTPLFLDQSFLILPQELLYWKNDRPLSLSSINILTIYAISLILSKAQVDFALQRTFLQRHFIDIFESKSTFSVLKMGWQKDILI